MYLERVFALLMGLLVITCIGFVIIAPVVSDKNLFNDEGFIERMVESGQDRYGNCYLYAKTWQWMERVPCDRIGKGG